MRTIIILLAILLGLAVCPNGFSQTVSWSGGGDAKSWNSGANWTGGQVPGSGNDVVINAGLGATVVIASGNIAIKSVTCTKALTLSGGSLTVSAGASQLSGPFALSGGASLTVQGAGTSLMANGATTCVDGNLYAKSGGSLRLPSLNFATNNAYSTTWRADGIGSLMDLSAVTNLGLAFYERVTLEAYNGGTVDLHRVAKTTGAVWVDARDANSVVDLSGLSGRWTSQANNELNLEAQSGASILIPNVTQLERASLRIDGAGAIPTSQLTWLTNVNLTVDGSAPDFGRVTNIDDSTVTALNGGAARLTNVTRVVLGNESGTWKADGVGSSVGLAVVTQVQVAYYERLNLQVYNGGTVDLHRLGSSDGAIWIDARDANSLVDLSGLSGRWTSHANNELNLEAQTGASILIPNVTQLERASLRIDNTGLVPTAQLTWLTNVNLTVDGSAPTFGRVTNIDDSSLTALNGGVARLTNVAKVVFGNESATWKADGTGSAIDLSAATSIQVAYYERLNLQAYNGGEVDLHRLVSPAGAFWIDARDVESVVDLSGLSGRWTSHANNELALEAQTGAAILIPNVTQLERASLRIDNGGMVPTAQLNRLTNVNLTVDGSAPSFGQVTNIDDSSLTALNGGIARLTNVAQVVLGNESATWKADGAGSQVDLSNLTNLVIAYYERLNVAVFNGGKVDLHRAKATTGALWLDARDADSVVDLSGLSGRWSSQANNELNLETQTGASILIPNITQLERCSLRVDDLGVITTAQLNLLTNVNLTVDGAAPDFGRVTNIDDTSVTALNGGIARLTNVTRVALGNNSATWKADGAQSLVDLSALTSLAVAYYERLNLDVYHGGNIDLHRVTSTTGAVWIDAQDAGSLVDLSGISGRWSSQANNQLQLEAQTGASILIPNVTQLERAALRIDDTGLISTAQLNLLTNVDVTVDGAAPSFGRVTNIDDTSVTAMNGGAARLTNVVRVTLGANSATWKAQNPGSLVDLSALARVFVSYYQRLTVQALQGGQVDLGGLESLSTGSVQVLADGANSTVDLSGLSSFISVGNSHSSLSAQNSGAIVLGSHAFLLANVDINIAAGNPVLPPSVIASSTLTLYGQPWHSYWVEKRDTLQPDGPWVFATRVPLVSALQPVAPKPPPNIEFRVWDFVADPPMLDLLAANGHQALMVLYGMPSQSYQILSGLSIAPGATWQAGAVAAMTNAFRIFAPVPATDPQRFFRAKKL